MQPETSEDKSLRYQANSLPVLNIQDPMHCVVLYQFQSAESDELRHLLPGYIIRVDKKADDGWWFGEIIYPCPPDISSKPNLSDSHGTGDISGGKGTIEFKPRNQPFLGLKYGWFPSNFCKEPDTWSLDLDFYYSQHNDESAPTLWSFESAVEHMSHSLQLVETIFSYEAQEVDEIQLDVGNILVRVRSLDEEDGWCRGINTHGDCGLFPDNFVKFIEYSASAEQEYRNALSAFDEESEASPDKDSSVMSHAEGVDGKQHIQVPKVEDIQRRSLSNGDMSLKKKTDDNLLGIPQLQNLGNRFKIGARVSSLYLAESEDDLPKSVKVTYAYDAQKHDELSLKPGMRLNVKSKVEDGWWKGIDEFGREGVFPANFVQPIDKTDKKFIDSTDDIPKSEKINQSIGSNDEKAENSENLNVKPSNAFKKPSLGGSNSSAISMMANAMKQGLQSRKVSKSSSSESLHDEFKPEAPRQNVQPEDFDCLDEIVASIGNNENFVAQKVTKHPSKDAKKIDSKDISLYNEALPSKTHPRLPKYASVPKFHDFEGEKDLDLNKQDGASEAENVREAKKEENIASTLDDISNMVLNSPKLTHFTKARPSFSRAPKIYSKIDKNIDQKEIPSNHQGAAQESSQKSEKDLESNSASAPSSITGIMKWVTKELDNMRGEYEGQLERERLKIKNLEREVEELRDLIKNLN